MEISDLRNSCRVLHGQITETWLCDSGQIRAITDTGFQIYFSPEDIKMLTEKKKS